MSSFDSVNFSGSAALEERLFAPAATGAPTTHPTADSGVMDVSDVVALLRELRVRSQLGDRE